MAIDPAEVRALITARLEALTPLSSYTQDTADAWRASALPIAPEYAAPSPLGHLLFWVDDRDTALLETSGHQPDYIDGAQVAAPVTVRFLAQLRAKNRDPDWDVAGRAALHALQHLAALDHNELSLTLGLLPMRRIPVNSPDWLRVEVRLVARYTLSLIPGA